MNGRQMREEIEQEVERLLGSCLTERGKVAVITDYIVRLLHRTGRERS